MRQKCILILSSYFPSKVLFNEKLSNLVQTFRNFYQIPCPKKSKFEQNLTTFCKIKFSSEFWHFFSYHTLHPGGIKKLRWQGRGECQHASFIISSSTRIISSKSSKQLDFLCFLHNTYYTYGMIFSEKNFKHRIW